MKKYTSNVTTDPILSENQSPNTDSSTAGMTTKVVKARSGLFGEVLPLDASLLAASFVIRFFKAPGYGVLILIGKIHCILVLRLILRLSRVTKAFRNLNYQLTQSEPNQ